MSLYSLSHQANMDCVNSYWLNWIKWNEYCENDSIEIVRSVFIRNMWFVDSSMKNQSCIVKIQSENEFNKHKEGKIAIFESRAQSILTLRIRLVFGWWLYNADSTLTCINEIDWHGFLQQ